MIKIQMLLILIVHVLLSPAISLADSRLTFPQSATQWAKALSAPVRPLERKGFRQGKGITVGQDAPAKAGILIQFASNSARMQAKSNPALDSLGLALTTQLTETTLLIIGHTDSIGSRISNLHLSKRRAKAVRRYLMRRYNISLARLKTTGYGEDQPIASNLTKAGRALNRRVELQRIQ